jgi:hypothetical protein
VRPVWSILSGGLGRFLGDVDAAAPDVAPWSEASPSATLAPTMTTTAAVMATTIGQRLRRLGTGIGAVASSGADGPVEGGVSGMGDWGV